MFECIQNNEKALAFFFEVRFRAGIFDDKIGLLAGEGIAPLLRKPGFGIRFRKAALLRYASNGGFIERFDEYDIIESFQKPCLQNQCGFHGDHFVRVRLEDSFDLRRRGRMHDIFHLRSHRLIVKNPRRHEFPVERSMGIRFRAENLGKLRLKRGIVLHKFPRKIIRADANESVFLHCAHQKRFSASEHTRNADSNGPHRK